MFNFHKVVYVQYLVEVGIFHTSKKIYSSLQQCKNYKKSIKIFQSYDHKCTATFLWLTVYVGLQ